MQVLLQEHFLIMIKDKLKDKKEGNAQIKFRFVWKADEA
jgi:hypothetical protein